MIIYLAYDLYMYLYIFIYSVYLESSFSMHKNILEPGRINISENNLKPNTYMAENSFFNA